MTAMKESVSIIYSDSNGNLVSTQCVPAQVYTLGGHFALEQARWLNGGKPVTVLTVGVS